MPSDASNEAFLKNAFLIAYADGKLDPREHALIRRFMDKAAVTPEQATRWIEELRAGKIEFRPVDDPDDAVAALKLAIGVVAADGKLDERERRSLRLLTKCLAIPFEQLNALLEQVWGTDVLAELYPPAPETTVTTTPQEQGSFIAITDHFEKLDAFVDVSEGIDLAQVSLKAFTADPGDPEFVIFHAAPERRSSEQILARLRQAAPESKAIAVAGRHQGFQVQYLWKGGVSGVLIEDVYPHELAEMVATTRRS